MSLSTILILNAIVLISVLSFSSLLNKTSKDNNRKYQVIFGILFGITSIILMELNWGDETGVFYDARTILFAIVSVVYAPLTTLITVVFGVVYRFYQGGIGTTAGVVTILGTSFLGIIMKFYVLNKLKQIKFYHILIYGFVIHIFMLIYHFVLPSDIDFILTRIKLIAPVVLTLYPVLVTFGYYIVSINNQRIYNARQLALNEERYRLIFNGVPNGIIHFDMDGVILDCNTQFLEMMKTNKEDMIGLNMSTLPDKNMSSQVMKAIQGELGYFSDYYNTFISGTRVYLDVVFSPIFQNGVQVSGVAVVKDLTRIIEIKEELKTAINIDSVTNFFNRKSYEEDMFNNHFEKMFPLSYIVLSIDNYQFYIDTLGYIKVDSLLEKVSEIIKSNFANTKSIYKISQNDFVIIMSSNDNLNLDSIINKTKKEVNNIKDISPPISLTSSHMTNVMNDDVWPNINNTMRAKINSIRKLSKSSININYIKLLLASLFEKSEREKNHSERVSALATNIGKILDFDEEQLNLLRTTSILHDIGKINIDSEILEKPGKLTSDEFAIIKNHTLTGYRILSSVDEYKEVAINVLSHHERYDGFGYPNGIKGKDIPITSRIINVADSYDAMINDRPYRKALSKEEALKEIVNNRGTQFDPEIADVFIKIMS